MIISWLGLKNLKKTLALIAMVCTALLLSGCSWFEPSTSKMAELIQSALSSNSNTDFMRVENLVKTNGVKNGYNNYTADLQYDIVFTKSYGELMHQLKGYSPPDATLSEKAVALKGAIDAIGKGVYITTLAMRFGQFKANTYAHISAQITFIKSDNGWILAKKQDLLPGGFLGN